MSSIKIKSLKIKNYRSFGNIEQEFDFTRATDKNLPLAITGYNNAGKTNLMNGILYGIGEKYVNEETFELNDLHNKEWVNIPYIETEIEGDTVGKNKKGYDINITNTYKTQVEIENNFIKSANIAPSFFGMNKYYQIFYINFHKIKDEISTQKTSWGNLKSFLAKHIKKLVDEDEEMKTRKNKFKETVKIATKQVLDGSEGESQSKLSSFIQNIKSNYNTNLRDNNCEVEFGLPDYEDIFLQMMFKIGLNGDSQKLVPIDHFGDGYISMFVMAVIQAIAEEKTEEKTEDKCLFLFEEPESFLHENHQEYFYKMVLCGLADKGHQVIYTTHSDKMVDITKPDSLIRLEFDKSTSQTIKKFPGIEDTSNPFEKMENKEIISDYNSYIKNIEQNLNKILFSEKVVLVEGPNDLLVYKYLIEKKARELAQSDSSIINEQRWAETYLNFNNIAIIPHHGKATAYLLADLCKYLGVDYYLINDWDFEEKELKLEQIEKFATEEDLKADDIYINQLNSNKKGMITTNWKLLDSSEENSSGEKQIHFNIKKLETTIDYKSDDKNPVKIWHAIKNKFSDGSKIGIDIFPGSLDKFLCLTEIKKSEKFNKNIESENTKIQDSDVDSLNVQMPF